MKELHFEYWMKLSFDAPVEKHRFTLKCVPQTTNRQEIRDLSVKVFPKEFLSEDRDSFGNHCIYGYAEKPHDHFSVSVTGTAKTGLAPWEAADPPHRLGLFKCQTDITKPGPCIYAFYNALHLPEDMPPLEAGLTFMRTLHEKFQYVSGMTNISTTAEEAMALGEGVCQDYSHILLSLCRIRKIFCRYVVGMLSGEGLSHAWVELYDSGRWFALDPTNNLIVDDQHIKISVGRDFSDCTINKGLFVGNAVQTQQADVIVTDVSSGTQAAAQCSGDSVLTQGLSVSGIAQTRQADGNVTDELSLSTLTSQKEVFPK